jgi:CLIP-associating protein 1/2
MNAFEAVPKIQVKFHFFHSSQLFCYLFILFKKKKIYSAKDVDQHMSQINDCLADLNNDWEKRVDSLKRIRSVAIAASNQYDDEFFSTLKQIQVAFTHQIKDLRSQIVREACITIA